MNKQELIERLHEAGGCGADPETWARGYDDGISVAIDIVEQLDEPHKPVVPQFVADYIEYCHSDGNSLWEVFRYIKKMPNQVWAWLKVEKHQVIFSKAFGDGYEVEEIMDQKILDVGLLLLHFTDKNLI